MLDADELIRRLAELGAVAPAIATLPEVLGLDDVEISEAAALAISAGLVQVWERQSPRLSLTALAAERLGIVLNSRGTRWVRPEDPERNFQARAKLCYPDGYEQGIADREGPSEAAGASVRSDWSRVPLPRILLGLSLAWPVAEGRGGKCGACKGQPLEPGTYCLVCDRLALEPEIGPGKSEGRRPGTIPITGGGTGPRGKEPAEKLLPTPGKDTAIWSMKSRDGGTTRHRSRRSS